MASELPTASQERNWDATINSSKNMLTWHTGEDEKKIECWVVLRRKSRTMWKIHLCYILKHLNSHSGNMELESHL